MKTTRLIAIIVGLGALMVAPGFAGEAAPAKAAPSEHRLDAAGDHATAPGHSLQPRLGSLPKKTEPLRSQPALSPGLRPSSSSSLHAASSHGAGPAVVGGPAMSGAKKNGGLNGTGLQHKP